MTSFKEKIIDFFSQHRILNLILLFLVIFFSYEIFYPLGRESNDNLQTIRTSMLIVPLLCFGYGCYLKGKGKLNIINCCYLLMIIGFSLRIGYALYTGASVRQHDVEMYADGELNYYGSGHFSYIYTIYNTGQLPQKMDWQFYHPPLWHALVAFFMKSLSILKATKDVEALFNESIVVSIYVSCLTLYVLKEMLFALFNEDRKNLSLSDKKNKMILIMFLLLVFHSQFFVMSSWMNNDGLSFFFMILALFFGIRFHKKRDWKNVLWCAFSLSLGMTTKVSVAIICIPLGILFLYDIIDECKVKNYRIFLKAVVFLAICIPISSWFMIRNILVFHDPSISVPAIDPELSAMGVNHYSFFQRFGIPDLYTSLKESVFCILVPNSNGYMDYNVWAYTFKCSVLGEYGYWQGNLFAYCLVLFNIFLSVFSFFALFYTIIKERKEDKNTKLLNIIMGATYGISIFAYLIFQILYPVTCTQDFRYMILILLPGTYFVAKYLTNTKCPFMKILVITFVLGFISSSFLYFISCR